jgi:hypothetical protein
MANRLGKQPHHTAHSSLARWVKAAADYLGVQLRFRLSGNSLHLLCESHPCPDESVFVVRMAHLLKLSQLERVIPAGQPRIYAVRLYGRSPAENHPVWSAVIYLDQIDSYLNPTSPQSAISPEAFPNEFSKAQASAAQASTAQPPSPVTSASQSALSVRQSVAANEAIAPSHSSHQVSSRSAQLAQRNAHHDDVSAQLAQSTLQLAKQGRPQAIAHHLSETLSGLGIAVRVAVKPVPYPQPNHPDHGVSAATISMPSHETLDASRRLWVTCEAIYSPDPTVIGEPIAQRLRELELENFRDAVVVIQVQGEAEPDWTLRVDLTPTSRILTEWARWGDVEALSRLAKQALEPLGVTVMNATLNDVTLHLCVEPVTAQVPNEEKEVPEQTAVRTRLATLFERLSPQGIHAVALYGQATGATKPAWLEWLELPATLHPSLGQSVLARAQRGDLEAIAFLLHRCLNPDLDQQLATGGIRIQLLPRDEVLHVMCDAPICPDAATVTSKAVNLLRSLHLVNIAGIRIYGRRSGQKAPNWSHGVDFVDRQKFVPDPAPEFAATAAYVGELVTPVDESMLRRDLTAADLRSGWQRVWEKSIHSVRHALVQTQLFSLGADVSNLVVTKPQSSSRLVTQTALVWGAVGLLLALQVDWLLPRLVNSSQSAETQSSPAESSFSANNGVTERVPSGLENDLPPDVSSVSSSTVLESFTDEGSINADGAIAEALTDSPYPPFNSDQLDLKLALYYQHVAEFGPPDVLVIGSSRALRGVDPAVLEQHLGDLGYADLDVFNFGVNGATAQVTELVIRQILTPGQLPKLIVWADGARAFNSGRVDITYDGIATSEGYEQAVSGTLSVPDPTQSGKIRQSADSSVEDGSGLWSRGLGRVLTESYDAIDEWFGDRLASVSVSYPERDRLKELIHEQAIRVLPDSFASVPDFAASSSQEAGNGNIPLSSAASESDDALVLEEGNLTAYEQRQIDQQGFMPIEMRFDPASYYQNYAYVPGNYDRDYADFRLEGPQTEALQAILQLSDSTGVPVVFINLPLTQEYLDPHRMEYEQTFRDYMLNVSVNHEEFIFRDWGELWLNEPDYRNYFSDPSHLNRYGAHEISKRLAQDPLIPWPSSVSAQ